MSSSASQSSSGKAFAKYFGEIRPFKDGDSAGMKAAKMSAATALHGKLKKTSSQSAITKSASGFNQALVKVVFNGGAKNAGALQGQIEYLTREDKPEPTLFMTDSELGDCDGEMQNEELQEKLAGWAEDFRGNPRLGHTTHMVVSYPFGTDPEAARAAGLAFADAAFSSGIGGDCFDYVAVQHTDTKYPHTHIIIKNSGMYEGEWFSIRRDGEHNSDVLREIQVETAEEFGIALTATRRLERGLIEPAVNSKEYRASQKEGREAHVRSLPELERFVRQVIVQEHAETLQDVASLYQATNPALAKHLLNEAEKLSNGEEIMIDADAEDKTVQRTRDNVQTIEQQKDGILKSIEGMDGRIAKDDNPVSRTIREAKLGRVKMSVAKYFPEKPEFETYADKEVSKEYQQDALRYAKIEEEHRDIAMDVYDKAQENIVTRAHEEGIEPEKVLARYAINDRVSQVTAKAWERDDIQDIVENRPEVSESDAKDKVEKFHAFVKDQFETANKEIKQTLEGRGVFYEPELKREKEDREAEQERTKKPTVRTRPAPSNDHSPSR